MRNKRILTSISQLWQHSKSSARYWPLKCSASPCPPHTFLDGLNLWEYHQRSIEDQPLNSANKKRRLNGEPINLDQRPNHRAIRWCRGCLQQVEIDLLFWPPAKTGDSSLSRLPHFSGKARAAAQWFCIQGSLNIRQMVSVSPLTFPSSDLCRKSGTTPLVPSEF